MTQKKSFLINCYCYDVQVLRLTATLVLSCLWTLAYTPAIPPASSRLGKGFFQYSFRRLELLRVEE
jgi:hypothetical protein